MKSSCVMKVLYFFTLASIFVTQWSSANIRLTLSNHGDYDLEYFSFGYNARTLDRNEKVNSASGFKIIEPYSDVVLELGSGDSVEIASYVYVKKNYWCCTRHQPILRKFVLKYSTNEFSENEVKLIGNQNGQTIILRDQSAILAINGHRADIIDNSDKMLIKSVAHDDPRVDPKFSELGSMLEVGPYILSALGPKRQVMESGGCPTIGARILTLGESRRIFREIEEFRKGLDPTVFVQEIGNFNLTDKFWVDDIRTSSLGRVFDPSSGNYESTYDFPQHFRCVIGPPAPQRQKSVWNQLLWGFF